MTTVSTIFGLFNVHSESPLDQLENNSSIKKRNVSLLTTVEGRIMVSKDVYVLIPGTYGYVTFHG